MNFKAKQKSIRTSEFTIIEKRILESARIREEFPDRIPLVCEKMGGSLPEFARTK